MLQGNFFEKIKVYLQRVMEIAEQKNCSPIQLALAWVQHKGAVTVLGYYGAFALWGWGGTIN
jgi:aryl-alcohol dehydrogenase-like predicted oxidoreductase